MQRGLLVFCLLAMCFMSMVSAQEKNVRARELEDKALFEKEEASLWGRLLEADMSMSGAEPEGKKGGKKEGKKGGKKEGKKGGKGKGGKKEGKGKGGKKEGKGKGGKGKGGKKERARSLLVNVV